MDTIEGFYISGTRRKVDDLISNPLKYQYYIDNIKEYVNKGKEKLIQKLQPKGSSKREREEDYIKRVSDENYILMDQMTYYFD